MNLSLALTAAALLWAPVALTAQSPAESTAETDRLNAWFEERYEEQLAFSPIQQTFLGRRSGEIDDYSIEGAERQLAWQRGTVEEMRDSFDYELLTPEAKTSYDLWIYQYEQAREAARYRLHVYAFDQFNAIHSFFPQLLIAFHEVAEPQDMDHYLNRIVESARALRQLIEVSRAAAAEGIRPPDFAYGFVIDEVGKILEGVPFDDGPEDNAVWADATAKIAELRETGRIDDARADALEEGVRAALLGPWRDAYRELIAWQEEDRVHASREAPGVVALPDGRAFYRERLANQTTTSLTPDEIHETGLADVERLRGEMLAIKDRIGFQGELSDLFAQMRGDTDNPRFYYPDTDEGRQGYLDDATAAIERLESVVPEYFGLLPKAGLEVRRVEAFREQDGAAQHYYPGTPDGSRPGIYYAHLSDMASMPKWDLEVIAYHEGLPGHHMQFSIAQELTGLPTFRRQAIFGAYIEGWGLYTEWLADEMPGTYEDPYSQLGRLNSEIWRAVRLVLDTGLHDRGWSLERAVEYFLENTATSEEGARSEVMRYLVSPGQASSYKVGMLKIQELRREAEEALGERFDIREFHDVVLGGGSLPLELLERRVDQWVAGLAPRGDG